LNLRTLMSLLSLLTLCTSSPSFACPLVKKLVDFNCDGEHQVSVIGDSIVFGTGDERNEGRGGYVLRLQNAFPDSTVSGFGYPGITTNRLLAYYKNLFKNEPRGKEITQLGRSDIIIIDIGRNDYFNRNSSTLTANTIKRLTLYLSTELEKRFGSAPLFVSTILPLTRREIDLGFIKQVNMVLLRIRGKSFPAFLKFDTLSPALLGTDGLHPTSAGYDVLAGIAARYITGPAQSRSKSSRKDVDKDGVYDVFEKSRFKTSPKKSDSDEDGLKDGEEIFTHKTDPLLLDTDGDGVDDATEVAQGTM
jgi:lysophospholipase L1-like esterase